MTARLPSPRPRLPDMAQSRPLIHTLSAGEVSVSALARVDQEKARLSAEIQANLFSRTIGAAMMRPGTTYLGDADTHANRVREIAFVKSLSVQASIEMSNALLRYGWTTNWSCEPPWGQASPTGTSCHPRGGTLTTSGGSVANIKSTVSGALWMAVPNRGGVSTCT